MLTVVLIILFLLILLTGAFILTPMEFGVEIIRTANKNNLYLRFKIFAIPFKIRLNKKKNKEKKPKKKENSLSFENFRKNVSEFKEIYDTSKDHLRKMLAYVRRHSSVKSVDFQIKFGFDNAATTGISTGAIWGMGSFILKVVDSLIGIKKINMQVYPDFNNKLFEIYSKTILIMRPIHFIIIIRKLVKTYLYINNKINNIKGGA